MKTLATKKFSVRGNCLVPTEATLIVKAVNEKDAMDIAKKLASTERSFAKLLLIESGDRDAAYDWEPNFAEETK